MTTLRIACLQTAGTLGDVEANLAELDAAAAEAAAAGARLLVTPEMFLTGYDTGDRTAELTDQPLLPRCAEVARRHGIDLVVGLPERVGEASGGERRIGNCATHLDSTGQVRARRVKSHLFGELDRGRFVAGDDAVTMTSVDDVRLALLICYEAEFAELVRAAALAGAQAVIVPTANMTPFVFVCDQVIPVRAWENQVYVAYVNHIGVEADTTYVGHSSVVGPDGVAVASATDERALLVADLDIDRVEAGQKENPYLTDRRTALYASLTAELLQP